jgi:DNA adenine methylase
MQSNVGETPLGGRNGTQQNLLQRWNPDALIQRITKINNMGDRITVFNTDACKLIEEIYWQPATTILVDPPYYKKGKQLYNCYYENEDHIELSGLLNNLYQGCPGADIILTYDNEEFIERLYCYPNIEKVNRIYSI